MQSIDLDLGGLEIKAKPSGLQLRLTSQARFAPSAKDDIDTLYERLTSPELNNSLPHRPWITCDSTFQLDLSLLLDDRLSLESQADLMHTLSEQLRSAKIWPRLGLIAVSITCSTSSTRCHSVKVDLAMRENEPGTKTRKLHKLTIPPSHHIRPPTGVLSASLEEVHLELCMRRSEPQVSKRSKKLRSVDDFQCNPKKRNACIQPASKDSQIPHCIRGDDRGCDADGTTNPCSTLQGSEWTLESEDEDKTDSHEDMLLSIGPFHATIDYELQYTNSPSLLKRSSSMSNIDPDERAVCDSEILDLLDAAIRIAISGSTRNPPKGLELASTESLRHLAEIAPGVWRPKFLQAFAGRAVLLPTISHALHSVCFKDTDTNVVKSEVDERSSESSDVTNHRHAEVKGSPSHTSISTHLWQRLQQTILNQTAPEKLSCLFSQDLLTTGRGTPVNLIDTTQEDVCLPIIDDSGDESHDDLFVDDDDFSLIEGNCDEDLFDDDEDENEIFLTEILSNEDQRSKALCEIEDRIPPDDTIRLTVEDDVERSDDDMLSICESFSSLPLVEDCSNVLDDAASFMKGF